MITEREKKRQEKDNNNRTVTRKDNFGLKTTMKKSTKKSKPIKGGGREGEGERIKERVTKEWKR